MSKVVRNHKNRYMLIRTRNLNDANIITQEGRRIRHKALIKEITGQGGLRAADAKGQQKICRRQVYGGGPDLPNNSTTTCLFREEGQLNMTQMDECMRIVGETMSTRSIREECNRLSTTGGRAQFTNRMKTAMHRKGWASQAMVGGGALGDTAGKNG